MIIDIGVMAQWADAYMAIWALVGGFVFAAYKLTKWLRKLNSTVEFHEKEIKKSCEERQLNIEIMKTILEVVALNKNNGNVEEAMSKIDKFINEKAHEN